MNSVPSLDVCIIADLVGVYYMMASSSSSSGGRCKYDVFLSFRGEDTRKNFVCHLYKALEQKTIHTFIDSEELKKGNKISELLKAVDESSISIVVLSQNHASSTWCLKELVEILDCMDKKNQIVVPIFYEVDPSDIRKLKKKFGKAFAKHEQNPYADQKELEIWKTALTRIAALSGWNSREYKDDLELIEKIVGDILEKWIHIPGPSSLANNLVGMDHHIKEVNLRFCLGKNDVDVVGIWGMGGTGKTTIARLTFYGSGHGSMLYETVYLALTIYKHFRFKFSRDDIELIEKIVGDILEKWIHIPGPSSLANNLVGMDHHIKEVSLRLCRGKNDVGVVGIWGMGGIGKTTIARAVYEKIIHQFEHKCFFFNVKERFAKKDEAQMRGELLSMILKGNVQSVDIFNAGSNVILERLGKKKVLVVLDDVETFSQIEALLGDLYSFGVGSRILVTTRDKESLAASGVYETYEPRCLNHNESLELFMKHAFRTNQPSEEYSDLWKRAIEYAQGLPLALKVLGASLYDKDIHQWKEVLEKIKKIPQRKILDVLRTSFEGLDYPEKDIFLDIACLFREWNRDFVTEILDSCGFYPRIGLRVLVDRALITISGGNKLNMHDLLQEMGREIVRLQSPKEPGKRSRLWSYEDVNCVLTQNTATDAVQCLMLDLSNSKDDLCINTGAFVRMTKLRLLIIYYSFYSIFDHVDYGDFDDLDDLDDFYIWLLTLATIRHESGGSRETICPVNGCKQLMMGDFEFLSQELRFLLWHGYPLKSLPSTFIPKNLVHLDMRGSHIEQLWEGIKPLQNLKVIKLSHCQYLVKIPDLTEAINLEKLFLDGCSSLSEVHSSISALPNLHCLHLKGCKQLKILPSSIHVKSLQTLCLMGCSNLEKFPEIADVMMELKELYLDGTAIKELPSSINNLTGLRVLDLEYCTELKTLSSSIHMSSLRSLNLNGCPNLENFPEISGIMKELPELCLDGTAIKGLHSSIDLLRGLKQLSMRNCKGLEFLPDSICNLEDLTDLDLYGCSVLHYLPEKLGDLESLQVLDIGYSGIKQLPFSILRLGNLEGDGLSCIGCKEMTAPLSAWPSSTKEYCSYSVLLHLDFSDCNLLELSDGIAHLSSLKTLKLCRNNLESLPATMNRLCCLTHLELEACKRLKSIPELSSSINYIDAHDCTALETVSMPKPQYQMNHFFTFSNCLQLVKTNLFTDIVESHSHFQGNCLQSLRLKMSLPGSEVPDWFNHQSRGFSVSVHLPANWLNHRVLGLAICAVRKYQGVHHYTSPLSATCLCTFKGNSDECSFSFDMLDSVFGIDRFLRSDHMFLGYVSWSQCHLSAEGKLFNETYTEATFRIVVVSEFITEQHCITSCGVRFVYANHDEMPNILHIAQPHFLWDSWGMGIFSIDTCEMRNEETKRAEITEISMEVESLESGEDQLLLEQPKERKGDTASCGVSFVYANNDEMQNILSIAQPQVHGDSCGTGFFSMNTCEMRNEETERVEFTEISMEVGSLESEEGRDTSHTLPLLLEQPKERKGEKDTMEMTKHEEGCSGGVPGSVCSCLSLDSCIMSLEGVAQVTRSSELLEADALGELGILKFTL